MYIQKTEVLIIIIIIIIDTHGDINVFLNIILLYLKQKL